MIKAAGSAPANTLERIIPESGMPSAALGSVLDAG
jgi:hypothetical protein